MSSCHTESESPVPKTLLTIGDLCRTFGVSSDWVYRRTRSDALDPFPFLRIGRLLRFEVEQVRDYLKSRSRNPISDNVALTGGVARANEGRKRLMARKRFQSGYIRVRGKHSPSWEGFYREDILLPDGRIVRKRRRRCLASLAELPTKTLAKRKLAEIVAELNDVDHKPRAVVTVAQFVENKYRTLILPVRNPTTRRGYEVVLRQHVPRAGNQPTRRYDPGESPVLHQL